jgi:PD-(D/E)XK nuclease superfamily
LRRISADANRYDADLNRYNLSKFRGVVREDATRYIIASQRRIDITIDFGNAGIGIENKPWAGEQPDQLRDYAAHLAKKYREIFCWSISPVMAQRRRPYPNSSRMISAKMGALEY